MSVIYIDFFVVTLLHKTALPMKVLSISPIINDPTGKENTIKWSVTRVYDMNYK